MNSYELALTAPSRPRVYRFHHLGPDAAAIAWQGREDSNPGPAVLETAALPTELHPYWPLNLGPTRNLSSSSSTVNQMDCQNPVLE